MSERILSPEHDAQTKIDWLDVKFAVAAGVIFLPLKLTEVLAHNPWNIFNSNGIIMSVICVAYILLRAQREPNKLRDWGITAPISRSAILWFFAFEILSIATLAGFGMAKKGALSFDVAYLFRMIDYIPPSFAQQFVIFGLLSSALEKFPILRGQWRLPLFLGLSFGIIGHWNFPLYGILLTAALGFAATWYFLRFRTIIPLTVAHAIGFVLYTNWM